MKKKALAFMLAATTLTFALAGCGTTAGNTENAGSATSDTTTEAAAETTAEAPSATADGAEGDTIRLVNNKAEIQEGLSLLADAYKEKTLIHFRKR